MVSMSFFFQLFYYSKLSSMIVSTRLVVSFVFRLLFLLTSFDIEDLAFTLEI